MTNNKQQTHYKYPVGDFLSGFSEDSNNPCDYELECQRMVIRGVQYLDENPDVFELISNIPVKTSDKIVKPMIDFMCYPEDGQTGAMIDHTVKVAYHAKKMGWDEYIRKITEEDDKQ